MVMNRSQLLLQAEPIPCLHIGTLRGYRATAQGKTACRMDSDATTGLLAGVGGVVLAGLVAAFRHGMLTGLLPRLFFAALGIRPSSDSPSQPESTDSAESSQPQP